MRLGLVVSSEAGAATLVAGQVPVSHGHAVPVAAICRLLCLLAVGRPDCPDDGG